MRRLASHIVGVLLLTGMVNAQAQNYSFSCVTNNIAADCATSVAQLGLQVLDQGTTVDFRFSNTGPAASSITDVYFDWTSQAYQLNQGTITQSSGVSFSWDASPTNLPGGNSVGFAANIAADSNVPTQPMGVNPGEWVNFNFNGSYANVVSGLNGNLLRVGVHVQGFSGEGSESLVVSPIPEPEIYAMLLAGMGFLGFVARRRQRRLAA